MWKSKLTRNLFIVLFISSALTVGLIPNASSQQFTTSTLILTSSLTETSFYVVTSTGVETLTVTAEFQHLTGVCYFAYSQVFGSEGMTHIEYSISSPMILYILDSENLLAWTATIEYTRNCQSANAGISPAFYRTNLYGLSGSLDVNLPPSGGLGNQYAIFLARLETGASAPYPAATLTISPVIGVYTATEAVPIPKEVLVTSTTIVEVPLMQTYGTWIVAVVIAALILGVLFFKRRMKHTKSST